MSVYRTIGPLVFSALTAHSIRFVRIGSGPGKVGYNGFSTGETQL